MKGVILAGGLGTRLLPLTKVTNKHLLPVYDRPMIEFPLEYLSNAGIRHIMIVTGDLSGGEIAKYVGTGEKWGLKSVCFAHQEGNTGIAAALKLCENFVGVDNVVVFLGDNLFSKEISNAINLCDKNEATIFLVNRKHPHRFGVPKFDKSGMIEKIVEKPKNPPSQYAVAGCYVYPYGVFGIIKNIVPSKRGELEISDVNTMYAKQHKLSHIKFTGYWTDAGTHESLWWASKLRRKGVF